MGFRYNARTQRIESYDEEEDQQDNADYIPIEAPPEEDQQDDTESQPVDTSGIDTTSAIEGIDQSFITTDEQGNIVSKDQKEYFNPGWQKGEELRKKEEEENKKLQETLDEYEKNVQEAAKQGLSLKEYERLQKKSKSPWIWDKAAAFTEKTYKQFTDIKGEDYLKQREVLEGDQFVNNNLWAEMELKAIQNEITNVDNLEKEYNALPKETRKELENYAKKVGENSSEGLVGKLKKNKISEEELNKQKPELYDKFEIFANPKFNAGVVGAGGEVTELRKEDLKEMEKTYQMYLGKVDSDRDIVSSIGRNLDTYREVYQKLPFGGQLGQLRDTLDQKKIMEKYNRGEELTKEEMETFQRIRASMIEQRLNLGYGDSVGGMLVDMPTYIVEFGATGGLANFGKAGTTKLIGASVEKGTAEQIAKSVARNAIGELARTSIGFSPHIANRTAEYMLPRWDIVADEQGNAYIQELEAGDSFETAFAKAGLTTYVDNLTESSGLLVDDGNAFIKKAVLSKYLQNTAQKTGTELTEETASSFIKEAMKKSGWNGIIGEVFEEEIGEPVNAKIEGREYKDPITTPEGRERLLVETLGITIFQGISAIPDQTIKRSNQLYSKYKSQGINDSIDLDIDVNDKTSRPSDSDTQKGDPMKDVKPMTNITKMSEGGENNNFNVKEFLDNFEVADEVAQGLDARSNNKYNAALEYITQNVPAEQQNTKLKELRREANVDDPIAQNVAGLLDKYYIKNSGSLSKQEVQQQLVQEAKGVTGESSASEIVLPTELQKLATNISTNNTTPEKFKQIVSTLETSSDPRMQEKYKNIQSELADTGLSIDDVYKVAKGEQVVKPGFLNKPKIVEQQDVSRVSQEAGQLMPGDIVQVPRMGEMGRDMEFVAYTETGELQLRQTSGTTGRGSIVNVPTAIVGETVKQTNNNLNFNQQQNEDERNQTYATQQNSQQNQERSPGVTKETVWEIAVAQKELIGSQLTEEEKEILDVLDESVYNEAKLKEYTDNAIKVLTELETAQAGFRYLAGEEYKGQSSTFPDWFSLRTRTEIDSFLQSIPDDPAAWTIDNNPFKEGSKKSVAWGEFVNQVGRPADFGVSAENYLNASEDYRKFTEEYIGQSLEDFKGKLQGIIDSTAKQAKQKLENEASAQRLSDATDNITKVADQAVQKITTAQQRNVNTAPITQEVDNQVKNSRYYTRVRDKFEDYYKLDPTYETMNIKEDTARALNYVELNYEDAKRIALGKKANLPEGITKTNISLAVAEKARQDGDPELASLVYSQISKTATRQGQELVTLRGRFNDDSLKALMDSVIERRVDDLFRKNKFLERVKDVVEKKSGGVDQVDTPQKVLEKRTRKEAEKISKILDKENIKIQSAQEIIDLLTCK